MLAAEDFRAESRALAAILEPLGDEDFDCVTQFKDWTIDDVVGHLHLFNVAALKAVENDDAFDAFVAPLLARLGKGVSIRDLQYPWLAGLKRRALYQTWRDTAEVVADAFAAADPRQRLKWIGPGMSALSSITARQMETWAHGQEVFDILGIERQESDRIRNICHLGVNTFGWTFKVRGRAVPNPAPHVRLVAPSGALWQWNDPQDDNRIEGSAVDFARVVTQVRNVADTGLETTGQTAAEWMVNAQCFAGPPNDPPAPGARYQVSA